MRYTAQDKQFISEYSKEIDDIRTISDLGKFLFLLHEEDTLNENNDLTIRRVIYDIAYDIAGADVFTIYFCNTGVNGDVVEVFLSLDGVPENSYHRVGTITTFLDDYDYGTATTEVDIGPDCFFGMEGISDAEFCDRLDTMSMDSLRQVYKYILITTPFGRGMEDVLGDICDNCKAKIINDARDF